MTYSPLINETMPPVRQSYGDKWTVRPAGVVINGLIVHHHATTNDSGIDRLVKSADKASANYIIRNSGSLIGSVPEEYRAWTSGSYAADDDKITVEVQNETGAPEWRISDAAMNTLVRLYADIATRKDFAPDRAHISGHRDWAATSCPGPYLYPRLGWVSAQASGSATPVSNPVTPVVPASPAPVLEKRQPIKLPNVSKGSTGPWVELWQRVLNEVSGAGLKTDGSFGPATDTATRNFQRKRSITVDGSVYTQSWSESILAGGPQSLGSTGSDVEVWQAILQIARDRSFGPDTESKTKAAQRWLGIPDDGSVWTQTIQAYRAKA